MKVFYAKTYLFSWACGHKIKRGTAFPKNNNEFKVYDCGKVKARQAIDQEVWVCEENELNYECELFFVTILGFLCFIISEKFS